MTRRARNTCSRPGCDEPVAGRGLCNTHHAALRSRLIAYGKWVPDKAPIEPARDHVEALRAAGIGLPRLAELTGIPLDTLHRLSKPGRQYCSLRIYDAVMAIPMPAAPFRLASPGARVSSVGTVRRLRALAVIGYTNAYIAERLGLADRCGLNKLIAGRHAHVTASRAAAVSELFDELWDKPGPSDRARRWAAKHGWAPPMAWDDDSIDYPSAQPYGPTEAENAALDRACNLLDRYNDARSHAGASHTEAAARLGYDNPKSLDKALQRARDTIARWTVATEEAA